MSDWYQGTFEIQNKSKYIGIKQPFYRSSWEKRFMFWCDNNPNVLKWSSESIKIPYAIFENGHYKTHNYFPDFYMEVVDKSGNLKKYIVEVKPFNQGPIKLKTGETYKPKPPKNKNQKAMKRYLYECKMYNKNSIKWEAAKKYCQSNGIQFIVLTKNDLFNL
jgi:hypothetical protein